MSEPKHNIRVKVRASKDTQEPKEYDERENEERSNPHSNFDENGNYIGPVFDEDDEEDLNVWCQPRYDSGR